MLLTDWVNAKKWTNTSTFSGHYNKPLHIVYTPTTPSEQTNVQYQALNDGNGYTAGTQLRDGTSYSYNIGSVHSYSETGLMPYMDTVINGETRRFVLAGVRVDKPEGCVVGTAGRLAVSTEEDNLVVPAGSYATIDASLSDVGAIPGSGWTFRRDYSSVHSYVNGCNFRVSTGTTITYLYAEVKTVCKLYTAMRFDGYNTFNVMNAESPYRVNAGGTFDLGGEAALVPAITSYKGYVWELVQASFYKKGANILSIPTIYVANDAWGGNGSMAFRTMNVMGSAIDYNAWQQCVSDNNRVKITTSENAPADYVYAGRYQVAPPQIELSYYKDSKGRYHLFSYTSGGVMIDTTQDVTSQYRKNTWLDNGATTEYTVKSILRNQAVDMDGTIEKKDMVLTVKSYYTTEKDEVDDRKYYYEEPVAEEFVFGTETLKRGCEVQYPIGTTALTVEQAASQDGVGNEYGSLFKTRADGTTVECLRTRYFATNSADSVEAVKALNVFGSVKQSELYAACPLWATNWDGSVRFKSGVAAMVKLYEAVPVKGWWTVNDKM